jgi:RNA 3'-terminal phosphate cyclase (ATP)
MMDMAGRPRPPLVIDGAHGEGGGQILRTALALAALTGRSFELTDIRANRPKPGLAAQHLTAVRAAAAICDATLDGDHLRSLSLRFAPRWPALSGDYRFDVAEAREGGSAGSVTLVLQTVLLPLALADGRSNLIIRGGTHVPWSPSIDYVRDVWLPVLSDMGLRAELELLRSGWYPAGGGEIRVTIDGIGGARLAPLDRIGRGALKGVRGRAVAANLPLHIPQRMSERARSLLEAEGVPAVIRADQVQATCPGAAIFLVADYANSRAGFNALGRPGKPSETVAEEAVSLLLAHHRSGAAIDAHLGDQLLLPAALAAGESRFSVERVTRHLVTNSWVLEQFGVARVSIAGTEGSPGEVIVTPVA